ncbi:MAG: hypothetical protein NVSMB60_27600 [Mycobacterium sp.]
MHGTYGDSTRSVKAVGSEAIPGHPVAPPLVSASTYHLSADETESLDSYGRSSNPTWRQLESALAELEGAATALTFASGMAAIATALRVLAKPGTKLVVPADGYYQVRRYASEYIAPRGVTIVEATIGDMCDAAANADVVLVETPVNPGLDVVDLHYLAMTCRGRGSTLIVDNTTATPLGLQPLSLGADLVVASATKALAGHSDVLAGYIAGSHPQLMAALERERLLSGPARRPGASDRHATDEALRWFGCGGADRRCGGARPGGAQRVGDCLDQLRRYPHIGGPPRPLGRRRQRRLRPHLVGY